MTKRADMGPADRPHFDTPGGSTTWRGAFIFASLTHAHHDARSIGRETLQQRGADLVGQGLEVHSTASLLANGSGVLDPSPILGVL
jgi:hypothetical protein